MKRRVVQVGLGAVSLAVSLPAQAATSIHVFKNPDCGCCSGWVDHLNASGFAVQVTEVDDAAESRKWLGMPEKFGSCHTATVEGYVLEGHVPATDIKRLLATRPKALGLAVPGMRVGSPNMEMGPRKDPYNVLLVKRCRQGIFFSTYPK